MPEPEKKSIIDVASFAKALNMAGITTIPVLRRGDSVQSIRLSICNLQQSKCPQISSKAALSVSECLAHQHDRETGE